MLVFVFVGVDITLCGKMDRLDQYLVLKTSLSNMYLKQSNKNGNTSGNFAHPVWIQRWLINGKEMKDYGFGR